MKDNYDVIIIGAGISGLTNSALLSKFGYSCCVVEKEPVIGGYLQGFKRGEFVFDTSIHWLNQCGENGLVTKIFKLIGTDYPKTVSMPNIHRFKNSETNYLLTNNPNLLKEQLINDFPNEKKGIIKFFKVAHKIGKTSLEFKNLSRTTESMSLFEKIKHGLKILKTIIPMIPYALYDGDEAVTKGLNKFFKDKKLHNLFASENDLLSCLFPIAWAYINDYQMPITGGGQTYPKWLQYVTKYFENDIILKSTVTKILSENNTVKGLEYLKNGETHKIYAKYIISTIDSETLYENLIPKTKLSQKIIENLKKATLYYSGATISIAINCPAKEIGIGDELTSITLSKIKRNEHYTGNPLKSAISIISPSERDVTLAPKNKGTINIYIPADISYNNYWQTDRDENNNFVRGEKYKKHKEEFAKILIKRVENELKTDITSHIIFYDVSTPITYLRYTGNKNGTIMGARPGKKNMQLKVAHYKTPVKNLFLSGHWAELGGGVPIAVQSAINSSLLVVQQDNNKLFSILKKYIDDEINLETVSKSKLLKNYNNSWQITSNKSFV